MFIQRLITFLLLGFFVFIGSIESWWHADSFSVWLGIYLAWFAVIGLWLWEQRRATQRLAALKSPPPATGED